mgnify:CR=1 FL=1
MIESMFTTGGIEVFKILPSNPQTTQQEIENKITEIFRLGEQQSESKYKSLEVSCVDWDEDEFGNTIYVITVDYEFVDPIRKI